MEGKKGEQTQIKGHSVAWRLHIPRVVIGPHYLLLAGVPNENTVRSAHWRNRRDVDDKIKVDIRTIRTGYTLYSPRVRIVFTNTVLWVHCTPLAAHTLFRSDTAQRKYRAGEVGHKRWLHSPTLLRYQRRVRVIRKKNTEGSHRQHAVC